MATGLLSDKAEMCEWSLFELIDAHASKGLVGFSRHDCLYRVDGRLLGWTGTHGRNRRSARLYLFQRHSFDFGRVGTRIHIVSPVLFLGQKKVATKSFSTFR